MAIEKNRALAIKHALEHIDRHRKDYKDKEEQNEMLEMLIKRHNLKDRPKKKGGGTWPVKDLTVDRYREFLRSTGANYGKPISKKAISLQDVFMNGSLVIADVGLTKTGYSANAASIDSEDEGDEDEIPASEISEDAEGASSASTIVNTGVANTTAPSTQAEQHSTASATRRSPSVMISGHGTKRKLNIEDDKTPRPSSAPKMAPQAVDHTGSSIVPGDAEVPAQEHPPTIDDDEILVEQHIMPATSNDAPPASARLSVVVGVVKLSDETIVKGMDGVWTDIQSFSRKLLDGIQINGDTRADLILKPGPELQELYDVLFGQYWQQRARQLLLAGTLNARGILEACVAAAVWKGEWVAELPWKTPEEVMAMLYQDAGQIDRVLHESDPKLQLQTIVWQAGHNKVLDKAFQQQTVWPHAKDLADKFMLTIDAQLEALGATRAKGSSDKFRERRTDHVAAIFFKVLILHGQMKAAPDYYRRGWARSGAPVNPTLMEQIHAGQGEQEVMWTVTPVIEKTATQDAEWKLVCPAKVFSRPTENAGV